MKHRIIFLIALTVFQCGVVFSDDQIQTESEKDPIVEKLATLEKEQDQIQKSFDQAVLSMNNMKERFAQNAGAIKALREVARDAKTGRFTTKEDASARPSETVVEMVSQS